MKSSGIILSIAFSVIVFVAAFSTETNSQTSPINQSDSQPRWEYKVIDGSFGASEGKFNRLGDDGWEMVGSDFDILGGRSSARRYIFKRQR
jgi:hypothetical protein